MTRQMRCPKAMRVAGLASLLAVGVAGLLLTGCQTTQEPNYVVTEIISEPPGAKIEVNGNYLGEAPVKTKIRTHADGVVLHRTVIRAIPNKAGHFVQEKVFQAPQFPFDRRRDQAPHRVYFDMTLEPAVGSVGPGSSTRYEKMEDSSRPPVDETESSSGGASDGTQEESGESGEGAN